MLRRHPLLSLRTSGYLAFVAWLTRGSRTLGSAKRAQTGQGLRHHEAMTSTTSRTYFRWSIALFAISALGLLYVLMPRGDGAGLSGPVIETALELAASLVTLITAVLALAAAVAGRRANKQTQRAEASGTVDQLERLDRLRENGAINQQEYEGLKREVLRRPLNEPGQG